jgi:hypothetical protein
MTNPNPNKWEMKDYSTATLADVEAIVKLIKALRQTATLSQVSTARTQSQILRAVPAAVLCEVALKLQDREAR